MITAAKVAKTVLYMNLVFSAVQRYVAYLNLVFCI